MMRTIGIFATITAQIERLSADCDAGEFSLTPHLNAPLYRGVAE